MEATPNAVIIQAQRADPFFIGNFLTLIFRTRVCLIARHPGQPILQIGLKPHRQAFPSLLLGMTPGWEIH
eukprot:CAMPEP_0117847578 /NCGR_PEP_ID=MMETSP0949-20121206/19818_1 /TAXON_ID=44440 /ORGANISM="Chattonella subsalsa, Strain CCMP2191" /LENGTH=69 /DNA_ID=CAMNT_0005694093 /DNA_START=29 /DNA_END=238 /DNA_ORIENTATION=-